MAEGDMTSLLDYDVSTTMTSNITDAPTANVSINMTNGPAANSSDVEQPVGPSIPDGRKCAIGLYCFVRVYVCARFYLFEGVEYDIRGYLCTIRGRNMCLMCTSTCFSHEPGLGSDVPATHAHLFQP